MSLNENMDGLSFVQKKENRKISEVAESSQKAPPGLLAVQGTPWGGGYNPSDQPMEPTHFPYLLQLLNLRSRRTERARKPVILKNAEIHRNSEISVFPFLSLLQS